MRFLITALVLAQISAGLAFSQNVQKVGAWYVFSSSIDPGKQVALLQLKSVEEYTGNNGQAAQANLDVLCMKDRLSALAVDTSSVVPRRGIGQSGPVQTTLISYTLGGDSLRSESWAISEDGRTLSPYAEIFQGRRNREWANRIAHSGQIVLHFKESNTGAPVTVTFPTAGFAQALAAAHCSY